MNASFDLIIRGGTVIDGARAPRFSADVGVRDGRVATIGDLGRERATHEIDARGRIVAPGFIDCHTHDDQMLLSRPDMTYKISQGVTTVITGNCGISAAPLVPGVDLPMPLHLMGVPEHGRFARFGDFLAAIEAAPASVNAAAMVGHSTLRFSVMSDLDRPATGAEIGKMRAMVDEAMEVGAIGLSTGTFYPPAAAAPTEEIIEVARPLSAAHGIFATHMRDEGDKVLDSLEETFAIGRALGVRVVISHHKTEKPANFGRSTETLPIIRAAMEKQPVGLDCYPYNASSTMIKEGPALTGGRVLIAESTPHPELAGRDLAAIAADWGVDVFEAARRLQPGSAIYFTMDEADVRRILAFEHTMIGSDGLPVGKRPHPRLWGTFPRVLGHYSRDQGLFPLETAIWKMTGLTAKTFALPERGVLAVGNFADIVVFDASRIRDAADYDTPDAPAEGIDAVVVNGVLAWDKGRHTQARAGRLIRRARK